MIRPMCHSENGTRHLLSSRIATLGVCAIIALGSTGCFREKSIRMKQGDLIRPVVDQTQTPPQTVRQWTAQAEQRLDSLLPNPKARVLVTEDMVGADGKPVDIYSIYKVDPDHLQSLFHNYSGLDQTAKLVADNECIDQEAPPWPGFETVWIPINPDLSYHARIGYSKQNGQIRDANCIVILHGFFGDLCALRTRDLADALVAAGFHVLAIEIRGHGQTEKRYPNVAYTFGTLEVADLMLVSEWAEQQPHVRSTGLIGYCWNGCAALLAAWNDGRKDNDPSLPPLLAPHFPSRTEHPHFSAGIIAFSPSLRWEDSVDMLDMPLKKLKDPAWASIQNTIRSRMIRKGYPEQSGNLRHLIAYEYERCPLASTAEISQGYDFLRLAPYKDKPWYPKMDAVRVPTLIVHAANDPMNYAQDIADFMSWTANPNVAALIVPGGGHVGFPAYARAYYYSLIANFFDPTYGAAAKTHATGDITASVGTLSAN